jgi:hypothetical protein
MAKPSKAIGPAYTCIKGIGVENLSPLRLEVHRAIESSQGKTLRLEGIYEKLPERADSAAKRTAIRMAIKDLRANEFIELAKWACDPSEPGRPELQQWVLEFLQANGDTWQDVQTIHDQVNKQHNESISIPRYRRALSGLIPACVQGSPSVDPVKFKPR